MPTGVWLQRRNQGIYFISVIILSISTEYFSFPIKHLIGFLQCSIYRYVVFLLRRLALMHLSEYRIDDDDDGERWRESVGVYRKWHKSMTNVNWSIGWGWQTGRSNVMKHVRAHEIYSHWLLAWFRPNDIDSDEQLNWAYCWIFR